VDDAAAIASLAVQLGYPGSKEQIRRRLESITPRDDHQVLAAEIDVILVIIYLWSGDPGVPFEMVPPLLLVFGGPLFACALLLFSSKRWVLYIVIGLASLELLALAVLSAR
jgi:hypothetical protein